MQTNEQPFIVSVGNPKPARLPAWQRVARDMAVFFSPSLMAIAAFVVFDRPRFATQLAIACAITALAWLALALHRHSATRNSTIAKSSMRVKPMAR